MITGASKGIGLACAHAFAAERCSVHLAARDSVQLERVANDIRVGHDADVRIHVVDLSQPADQVRLAGACEAVDVLVNNAGAVPSGDLGSVDDQTLREGWQLKVFGYINLCRHVLPIFEARGHGVIVNVIGGAGARPRPGSIAAGMGNAALMALTQALGSNSLRHGVRVVGINPGPIFTERLELVLRASADARFSDAERWRELLPADPAPGTTEQVADVVTFLASDRASHVSGVVVPVDGGASFR